MAAPAAFAGGAPAGIPSIPNISPGLSQRCLQRLGPKAHGAAAARAAHACRKPEGPQVAPHPPANVSPPPPASARSPAR